MFRTLRPERAYVTEDVYDDDRAAARVERLMTAVDADLQRVSYEELDAIAAERWTDWPRWGTIAEPRDPDMIFTTGKFGDADELRRWSEQYPNLVPGDGLGLTTQVWRRDGSMGWRRERRGIICQSARQLHTIRGCPFRCAYCSLGTHVRMIVDMERYVEHLDAIVDAEPKQRLYKWDNITDVSCFEPEYGATELLVNYFANKPGKYLEVYVGKSDNIEHLLGLDHRGKTVLQFSISAHTQSTAIEPETADGRARVEAARACQQAGYIVRFRFSPIIPVRNWREENTELIATIFERTRPDVISLCSFGWMSVEEARACLDFDLLDPAYVTAMEAAAPFLEARGFTGGGGRPIPHDARAAMLKFLIDAIRRHHPTIPVSLCLETVEMWALFQQELGMPVNPLKAANYYCNCGPMCTPEHPLADGVEPGPSWFDGS